jgi:2-iminobutanoate/2-iminopropanoate deaminase
MKYLILFVVCFCSRLVSSFQIPTFQPKRISTLNMSSKKITEIKTTSAPAPVGPYSQAVLVGTTLYCSGQVALDPATGEFVGGGDVQEEARQVLKNMDAVLKEAGASAKNVVRCTVFLADLKDFAQVNEIYIEFFKDNVVAPSRSCVQVGALPKGALVEIDCIAEL